MIYYRDMNKPLDVYAYEVEPESLEFNGVSLVLMTEEEVHEHLNPPERYWTDGVTLLRVASAYVHGMWHASEEEVAALLPVMQKAQAEAEIARLRSIADSAIVPLQDAVDVGMETPEEKVLLDLWKKYRVALNRLPNQPGYPATITWPVAPV